MSGMARTAITNSATLGTVRHHTLARLTRSRVQKGTAPAERADDDCPNGPHVSSRKVGSVMHPHHDDVIVRQVRPEGAASVIFLLGTPTSPDQFTVVNRDAAISRALAFATRFYVRAWFANDTAPDAFVLLGTFRKETAEGTVVKSPARRAEAPPRQATETPLDDLAMRIRAEFLELPGMSLTGAHIQRLCGVERSPCQASLDALVAAKFLCVRGDGTYTWLSDAADVAPRRPTTVDLDKPTAL